MMYIHSSLPEVASITESVVENTLLNLLKEVSTGELRLSAPLLTIADPPPQSK